LKKSLVASSHLFFCILPISLYSLIWPSI
jgi:hypothetical protein